jgi:hypothetical protein
MRVNIKQGARPDVDLCRTCASSTLIEGVAGTQQIKRCGVLDERVPFPVTACNEWQDRRAASLWDMQQIAWAIEIKGARRVGFLTPAERRSKGDPDIR